ncbi:hypothetical protein DFQ30_006744 [Apophysomyces sp. BC1015]|nr:hypothetical protein DFQ30_006744 [Apophysomyces sp. BC1015]
MMAFKSKTSQNEEEKRDTKCDFSFPDFVTQKEFTPEQAHYFQTKFNHHHQPSDEQINEAAKSIGCDATVVETWLKQQNGAANGISRPTNGIPTVVPIAFTQQSLNSQNVTQNSLSNASLPCNSTLITDGLPNVEQSTIAITNGTVQQTVENINTSTIPTSQIVDSSSSQSGDSVTTLKKLETSNEIEHFVEWMEKEGRHVMRMAMLNCLQHSKNYRVLQSFVQIPKACLTLHAWLDCALREWDPVLVKKMIQVLSHLPFDFDMLRTNKLGRVVKLAKKMASKKNNMELDAQIQQLMDDWRQLIPKSDKQEPRQVTHELVCMNPQSNFMFSDKDYTTELDSKPAATPPNPITEKKPIRLALQKEPPVKPKAITNTAFFSSLTAPQKARNIPPASKSSPVPTTTTLAALLDQWKKPEDQVSNVSSSSSGLSRSKSRKRVQFAPDYCLVEVREYEKVPEEWNIDTGPADTPSYPDNLHNMDPRECRYVANWNLRPQIAWYPPRRILLPSDVTLHTHVDTEETRFQAARERTALAKIYTNIQHIPYSPAEPEETLVLNDDCRVIPLEDTTTMDIDEIYTGYQAAPETPQHLPQTPTFQPHAEEKPQPFLSQDLIQSLQKIGVLPVSSVVDTPANIISNHPTQQNNQVMINEPVHVEEPVEELAEAGVEERAERSEGVPVEV